MNCIKLAFPALLFILIHCVRFTASSQATLPGVYAALESGDTAKINAQLGLLDKPDQPGKDAYSGALLMRKSGFMKSGPLKLKMFKQGRILLENSIAKDSLNAEYRFLRLIIQENIPDFLNYHKKKKPDAEFIRQAYKKLEPDLQVAIRNYSEKSKVLRPEDFQK